MARWQTDHRFQPTSTWARRHWVSLLSQGPWTIIKFGSAGAAVRRLQRALNANGARIVITGVFDRPTDQALRHWQTKVGIPASGVAAPTRLVAAQPRPVIGKVSRQADRAPVRLR